MYAGLASSSLTNTQIAPSPSQVFEEHPYWSLLSTTGLVTGAYHGYRRNNSIGWAIGWALLGGLFPFITIPVSLAQGFGKPAR